MFRTSYDHNYDSLRLPSPRLGLQSQPGAHVAFQLLYTVFSGTRVHSPMSLGWSTCTGWKAKAILIVTSDGR